MPQACYRPQLPWWAHGLVYRAWEQRSLGKGGEASGMLQQEPSWLWRMWRGVGLRRTVWGREQLMVSVVDRRQQEYCVTEELLQLWRDAAGRHTRASAFQVLQLSEGTQEQPYSYARKKEDCTEKRRRRELTHTQFQVSVLCHSPMRNALQRPEAAKVLTCFPVAPAAALDPPET